MKKLILIGVLLGNAIGLRGEEIRAIDLNAPLADARLGMAWDFSGQRLGVAHVPLIYWVGHSSGREYFTLNFGVSDDLSNGKAGYLASAGFRMDNLFVRAGNTAFSRKHLRFALLPPLQVSPSLITTDFRRFIFMLSVLTRFGGKQEEK